MVLRVYRVDCYFHFFVFGFSQDLQFRRGISVHVSFLLWFDGFINFMYN